MLSLALKSQLITSSGENKFADNTAVGTASTFGQAGCKQVGCVWEGLADQAVTCGWRDSCGSAEQKAGTERFSGSFSGSPKGNLCAWSTVQEELSVVCFPLLFSAAGIFVLGHPAMLGRVFQPV